MADEHIGSLVLIDCGPSLGTYQGRIATVEPSAQTITLEQPLRNGVPFQVPKVTLKSENITDLKILQLADEFEQTVNDVLTSCRGGPKTSEVNGVNEEFPKMDSARDGHFGNGHRPSDYGDHRQGAFHGKTKVATKLQQHSPGNLIRGNDDRKKSAKSSSPSFQRPGSRPTEDYQAYELIYDKSDGGRRMLPYDGHCSKRPLSDLCAPLDHNLMSTDFDFEGNLAMFEKIPSNPDKASAASISSAKQTAALHLLFDSLDGNSTKILSTGSRSKSKNIRHDENVVQDPSRVYVNAKRTWRYLTEDGVEVQSLTAVQKRELYERALRKGYITQDGFTFAVADSAAHLSLQLLRERNVTAKSVSFYMIFSGVDPAPKQIAKHLSRFMSNRGHSVTWILTGAAGQYENEYGVKVVADSYVLHNSPLSLHSFVFVIGRQGPLADDVSSLLLQNDFCASVFVESDWRGVESAVPDEDLLVRLGMDGGSLTRIPSRVLLCWQLPCEEADADLKSPVYVCDINMPSRFIENELPALSTVRGVLQKSKPYKFPFCQGNVMKLRKL